MREEVEEERGRVRGETNEKEHKFNTTHLTFDITSMSSPSVSFFHSLEAVR